MRQIPNAEPESRLIRGATSSIPGGSAELRHPPGPRTTHLKRPMTPLGQFPAAGGLQTFFRRASVSLCVSSERSATTPFESGVFLFHLAQSAELAHAPIRVLLFPGIEGGLAAPPTVGRGRRLESHSQRAEWPRRAAPRTIVPASSIRSVRRGPFEAAILLSF